MRKAKAMDIDQYIQDEVTRQHSTQFSEFRDALEYAKEITDDNLPANSMGVFAQNIARKVDPNVNSWWLSHW